MIASREVRLVSRPVGAPTLANFETVKVNVPAPREGEVQVRNLWMAVDPAMRGRMSDAKSYVPPFELNEAMQGPAIGEVLASNDPAFKPGDKVFSRLGWREAFNAPASALKLRDCSVLPPQAYLGFAGMTGLTAYAGLLDVAGLKDGDVVFVSAASGGVGSTVCQIAKLKGHKVIGSAGGARKAAFLKETLGIDEAIDYKAEPSLTKALARAAPKGIDVYFENVGGEHLQAALAVANHHARFALCGMISVYNSTEPSTAPRNLMQAVIKSIRMQGFIALNYMHLEEQFLRDVTAWHKVGKLTLAETVHAGVDHSLDAFFGLFSGDNLGRMLVKLG
jgi:NADPH-dependent curcumin reductase CurA